MDIKRSTLLLLVSFYFSLTPSIHAQHSSSPFQDDIAAAKIFQQRLAQGKKDDVAALIHYPLERDYPLPPIQNSTEFINHWDEYFDAKTISKLTKSEPEPLGWHGVNLANGCIWFSHGKVISLNCRPEKYAEVFNAAKQAEWAHLYPTAQGYHHIWFQCQTDTLRIRVQRHDKDLRYFAWKVNQDLSTKPQLELHNGDIETYGTGGNYGIIFKRNSYTYKLEVNQLCEGESCNNYLIVSKNDQPISKKVCGSALH